jgi:hypothetical protein
MFTIAKPDKTLRSLADLRELNKRLKRNWGGKLRSLVYYNNKIVVPKLLH